MQFIGRLHDLYRAGKPSMAALLLAGGAKEAVFTAARNGC